MNKVFVNKILVIGLHVCGWALLFSLPFRFLNRTSFRYGRKSTQELMDPFAIPFDPTMMKVEALLSNSLLLLFFYSNMFVFVPKILTKKGWASYAFIVALSLGVYLIVSYFFRLHYVQLTTLKPPLFIGVPNFFMVFGLSLALRLMQDRSAYDVILKERENEKLKSELSFLRSQVSPHFMFNVLNSLASLARKKSDQLEPVIIQLSQLMRYSLYHTDRKVTLEQEAEYLSNYIELQRMRFGSSIILHFHVNIERKDLMIEPMLLVPFVENAFKHGGGLMDKPVINVKLEASNYGLTFNVQNKFNPAENDTKDSNSGIGLQNVTRRLDLLYKDLYALNTYIKEEWFIVELKLIAE